MLALTLLRPWPWSILYAGKLIENRTWGPRDELVGERFALHAGKSYDDEEASDFIRRTVAANGIGLELPPPDEHVASAIVGVATIDRVIRTPIEGLLLPEDQRRWYMGNVGIVLRDVRALPSPILNVRGAQGFWKLAASDHMRILRMIGGAT